MTRPDHDPLNFAGKTVLVTGGNGGIGQGIVAAFLERDAHVVIADRSEPLQPLANPGPGELVDMRVDITDRSAVDAMVGRIVRRFGGIDVLVNNAGAGKGIARLADLTPEIIDSLVSLNIYGTLNCTQATAKVMVERRSGAIVNISSCAALSPVAGRYDPVYAGCKGFINTLTKALAMDLGDSAIRVNTVAPAWIVPEGDDQVSEGSFWRTMSDQFGTPEGFNSEYRRTGKLHASTGGALNQLGRPKDIAYAVIYFASDAARHVTGQILSVCGGVYMPS